MIGFDIGTTRSKVAFVDQAGKPNAVLNARGDHSTPSVLYFPDSDAPPLVGLDAAEQCYLDPERGVRNFKLDLGSTESLLGNGRVVTPTDATAALIAQLKDDVERQLGVEVREAVATCPANFRDHRKQALIEAFERNGIRILRLVPEPTAAGIAYALGKQGRKALTYIIFDWGGGTFDVSIQKIDGDEITTLSTEGIRKCGGNDLNDCLVRRVLDQVEAKFGKRPSLSDAPLFRQDLQQRSEAAKISLGGRPEVPIVAAYNGSQVVVRVTQEDFHKDIDPIIGQPLEAVDRVVEAAGLTMDRIDHVIMVGGTSRMPYIQDVLARHTGKVPKTDIDPEKAISYGAALASVSELAKQGRTATIRGQVIPAPDMFARDVTAHAVGCCVVDTAGPNKRMTNAVIIPKNTAIPCRKSDQFHLEHEDQTEARIEILQGEEDANHDDCLLVGELVLKDLPRETKRSQRIQVEYIIDANGMVTATATDTVSGQQQTVSVDYKKGIQPKKGPAAA